MPSVALRKPWVLAKSVWFSCACVLMSEYSARDRLYGEGARHAAVLQWVYH